MKDDSSMNKYLSNLKTAKISDYAYHLKNLASTILSRISIFWSVSPSYISVWSSFVSNYSKT